MQSYIVTCSVDPRCAANDDRATGMNMSSIWITWERQRRNRSMAASVGATLHELEYRGSAAARYCVLALRTVRLIRSCRPEVIFFQNPSLLLAALIAGLKAMRLIRCKTVGDFHNAGVFPPTAAFLVPWIVRHCDLVIVSNQNLAPAITAAGGQCISIPDPLPKLAATHSRSVTGSATFNVFFVCSWAPDEPIAEVLRAARLLAETQTDIRIAITGRPKLAAVGWSGAVPDNVELTGYLADVDFETRLASCSVLLDLTTRSDCMVCGAYEAVSAGVPMILSDNEPTVRYFHQGALYTDNTAASIAALIVQARARQGELRQEVAALQNELAAADREALHGLLRLVSQPG